MPANLVEMIAKKHLRIFVLDNNLFSLGMMEQHLLNLGYPDVTAFDDAEDCVAALNREPDIVFIDQVVNNVNDGDVLRKMKRTHPEIYVIFIASLEQTGHAVEAFKNGAFDLIIRNDTNIQSIDSVIMKVNRVKTLLNRVSTNSLTKFS